MASNFTQVHSIRISGIPKERVSQPLRGDSRFEDEGHTYSFLLSCSGRVTNNRSNSAYLDSRELAEKLLNYWMPQLINRGWGDFKAEVKSERADKWQLRWMDKSSNKARELLLKSEQCASPRKRKEVETKAKYVIQIKGFKLAGQSFDVGYAKALGKKIEFSTSLNYAKRYKTQSSCQKVINKANLKSPLIASVIEISDSDIQSIENAKSEYWDCVR